MVQIHFAESTILSWNFFHSHFPDINFRETTFNQIQHLVKKILLQYVQYVLLHKSVDQLVKN